MTTSVTLRLYKKKNARHRYIPGELGKSKDSDERLVVRLRLSNQYEFSNPLITDTITVTSEEVKINRRK